jgi:cell division protein FtsL
MTDWTDGTAERNYGIKCKIDTAMLTELMRTLLAFSTVAGTLLFYSWVRSQIVNIGYQRQNLSAVEESLLRIQKSLILEEETLRNPERIDMIARNELGMSPLRPGQLVQQRVEDRGRGASDTIALADSGAVYLKPAVPASSTASSPFR